MCSLSSALSQSEESALAGTIAAMSASCLRRSDAGYVFDIELANSDRGVYESLSLRIARHPSETAERMLTRGALLVWIDVGAPEPARLHRASKAARRVAVYTHKDAAQLAVRLHVDIEMHHCKSTICCALSVLTTPSGETFRTRLSSPLAT